MFQKKQEENKPQYEKFDTLVGKSTVVEGTLKTGEPLRVDGVVEGEIISQADLIIGEKGRVKGNVTCQHIMLAGEVEGNIQASGQLHITSTGALKGDAEIHSFIVDEQGLFDGKCHMVKETTPTPSDTPTEEQPSGDSSLNQSGKNHTGYSKSYSGSGRKKKS